MRAREHAFAVAIALLAAGIVAAMISTVLRSCEVRYVGGYSCSAWLAQCAQHRSAHDCYTDALVLGCSHRSLGSLDRIPAQGGAHERDHAEGEHDVPGSTRHVGADDDHRNAHE